MDKKIFLDSGIMISLGVIHKICGSDISKIATNKSRIHQALQEDSINILDQDVNNLCNLYCNIVGKKIDACVPPFVYKEIIIDANNPSSKLTADFFYNTNCYLAMPSQENGLDTFVALKTILYSDLLEDKVKVPESKAKGADLNNPKTVIYGLGTDSHNSVDVNNEDRWLLSQIQVMSELNDEDIAFIPGKEAIPYSQKKYLEDTIKAMYKNVEDARDDRKFAFDYLINLGFSEQEITSQTAKRQFTFLQENEKDYGREALSVRTRKYAIKNENADRDVEAMDKVIILINKMLSGVNVTAPTSRELSQILTGEHGLGNPFVK